MRDFDREKDIKHAKFMNIQSLLCTDAANFHGRHPFYLVLFLLREIKLKYGNVFMIVTVGLKTHTEDAAAVFTLSRKL